MYYTTLRIARPPSENMTRKRQNGDEEEDVDDDVTVRADRCKLLAGNARRG